MFEFLSFGGGVNSTAVMVLLKPSRLIFADTGDEHPDTYHFIENTVKPYVNSYNGLFITVRNRKFKSLKEQAFKEKIIPVRVNRWCTDKFKIRPIHHYLKDNELLPCTTIIAIDSGESHRATESRESMIIKKYPLIERDIDRQGCIEIIKAEGLPVPRKSGCFYCPFQSKPQWIALRREHPDLFQIAVNLEQNGSNYGEMFLAGDKPLVEWLASGRITYQENQLEMALPCTCYDG